MVQQKDLAIQDRDAALQRMNSAQEDQGKVKIRRDEDQAMIDRMGAELQQLQGLAQVRQTSSGLTSY